MSRTALTLVALLAGLPVASAQSLEVEFNAPAQAAPEVTALDAAWALVVFGPGTEASFGFGFPADIAERNYTFTGYAGTAGWVVSGPSNDVPQESGRRLEAMAAEATFDQGLGSLYLQGKSIRVVAREVRAEFLPSGSCVRDLMSEREGLKHEARYGDLCPPETGVAVVARPQDASGTVSVGIEAEGLDVVEWHNARTTCDREVCPDGGVRRSWSQEAGGQAVFNDVRSFHRLSSREASAQGSGQAVRVVLGGVRLDLDVAGQLRLPLATAAPACEGCPAPDGQNLEASGDLTLRRLRLGDPGMLRAGLGGDVADARFDEQAMDPASLFGWRTVALSAGAAAVVVFAKALFVFFTRMAGRDVLANPRSRLLLDTIVANPGIHVRALARLLGWGKSVVRYHSRALERHGHIVARRHGKALGFFENHGRYAHQMAEIALLRDESLHRLHAWIGKNPGASRAQAVRHAVEEWGWSRRTAYHRLRRLADAGL